MHFIFFGPGEPDGVIGGDGDVALGLAPNFDTDPIFLELEVGFGFTFELGTEVASGFEVAAGVQVDDGNYGGPEEATQVEEFGGALVALDLVINGGD